MPEWRARPPDMVDELLERDAALAELNQAVRPLLGDDPAHDVAHALRVARSALRLGEGALDAREVLAAALLHDVVNLPKNSCERASASARSADEARRRLPPLGFSPAAVERIAEAIEDHSFSRGAVPRSLLGRALQDADRLEALGAIGLFRCIGTGQRMGGRYFDPEDPWAERRPLDDKRYSVDHFFTKLLRLSMTMNTEAGRREAERRVVVLEQFLDALADELGSSWRAAQREGPDGPARPGGAAAHDGETS